MIVFSLAPIRFVPPIDLFWRYRGRGYVARDMEGLYRGECMVALLQLEGCLGRLHDTMNLAPCAPVSTVFASQGIAAGDRVPRLL